MSTDRVPFQSRQVVEIRHDDARILVAPEAGGRLLLWEVAGRRIIYWPEEADWSLPSKIRGGNPLLFPFLGRHFVDGVIDRWRDESGVVRQMPMHGFARTSPFDVLPSPSGRSVAMELTPNPAMTESYPHDFRFRVVYEVESDALRVRFETENRGSVPLPYYAGHHFYFAIPAVERSQWTLQLPSVHQARQSADGQIVPAETHQRLFLLNQPELQDTFHILDGPGQTALMHPDGRAVIFDFDPTGVPWHTVTTWTEKPESPFYCVEPWLGLPNAIHHGQGLRRIEPGAVEHAVCILRLHGW